MEQQLPPVAINLAALRAIAGERLVDVPGGEGLSPFDEALITLGVAASVTSLDRREIDRAINHCFAHGATPAQIQEVVSLVSGLGVHSLMVTATRILALGDTHGHPADAPLTQVQQELWDRHVGGDPFWTAFEDELPGFLDAMLRLSSDQFVAFFDYCAVPWKSGTVRARVKELIAMASDATPAHCFAPGFKLHLANAIKLGAGRAAIERCLDIAAAAPPHVGTP